MTYSHHLLVRTVFFCVLATPSAAQTINTIAGNPARTNVPVQQLAAPGFASAVTVDSNGVLFAAGHFAVYRFSGGVATLVAGAGTQGPTVPGAAALATRFSQIGAIAVAANGDLFIADEAQQKVFRVRSNTGLVEVLAGGGSQQAVSNVPATQLALDFPSGLELDSLGRLYVADSTRVYRIDLATGVATHIAGNGLSPSSGDNGPATVAGLTCIDVTVDSAFNAYCAELSRIRRITPAGTITTFAGTGTNGSDGNGGPAASALVTPRELAIAGNFLVFAEPNRVRSINLTTTTVALVAGTGTEGFSADGTPALSAQLRSVVGLAASATGGVFVLDSRVVRQINAGVINTVAFANSGVSGIGGPALLAQIGSPRQITRDVAGNVYFATFDQVFRIAGGVISHIAGTGVPNGPIGDGGPAVNATLLVGGLASDGANVYISQFGSNRIRIVNLSTGLINNFAGTGARGFDDLPVASATFDGPSGLLVDSNFLFVADSGNRRIRRINLTGGAPAVTTIAGNGAAHTADGQALVTGIGSVDSLAGTAAKLYFCDGRRVRKLVGVNIISVAGNGSSGVPVEGGAALQQPFGGLFGVFGIAASGSKVFLADFENQRVWVVDEAVVFPQVPVVNGLAGNGVIVPLGGGVFGDFSGDGEPAGLAALNGPFGLAFDGADLLIADSGNSRIRRVQGLANVAPTMGPPTNVILSEDTSTTVGVVVGDTTAPATLVLTATSSNTNVVAPAGLSIFNLNATIRTITVVPQPNAVGTTVIALTLMDTEGGVTRRSFTFTTTAVNDAPTLAPIADVTFTDQGPQPVTINFTDPDGPVFTFSATSSNQTVLPNANLGFSGFNPRTLTMTPVPGFGGTATVTLTLSDGTFSASRSFQAIIVATLPPTPVLLRAAIDGSVAELQWSAPSGTVVPTAFHIEAGDSPGTVDVSATIAPQARRFALPLPANGTWFVRVRALNGVLIGPPSDEEALTVTGVPGRPRNLTAAVAGNLVTFRWTLPTNGTRTSYRLDVGTASGQSNLQPVVIPATATSATLTAANGTTFMRLVAINGAGSSVPSNEIRLVVGGPPGPPAAPSDVQVAVDGVTAVFHWASPPTSGVPAQFVLDAGAGTPGLFNLVTGIPFGSGFTLAASAPPGTYNVQLRGVNAGGSSPGSSELFVTLPTAAFTPSAPALLRANVEPTRLVTLAWTPPFAGAATGYLLEAGTGPGLANLVTFPIGPAPELQVGAPPGTYFVRVRAVNSAGVSVASNEIVVVVQ